MAIKMSLWEVGGDELSAVDPARVWPRDILPG